MGASRTRSASVRDEIACKEGSNSSDNTTSEPPPNHNAASRLISPITSGVHSVPASCANAPPLSWKRVHVAEQHFGTGTLQHRDEQDIQRDVADALDDHQTTGHDRAGRDGQQRKRKPHQQPGRREQHAGVGLSREARR